MIHTLALTTYFGIPAVAYGGMITLTLMITTAILSHKNVKYHQAFAIATICVALFHGLFGMSIVAGF